MDLGVEQARAVPKLRIVVAEELTEAFLERYQTLVAAADACYAVTALDGRVALDALNDKKWVTGDLPLFDRADISLAKNVRAVVDAQSEVQPLTPMQRALLVQGVETRLRGAAFARAIIGRMGSEMGELPQPLHIDVVADDPYLRDSLLSLRSTATTVRVHPKPARWPTLTRWRSRASESRAVRALQLAAPFPREARPIRRSSKALALFVFSQRSLDLFRPVGRELRERGWDVLVFSYAPLADADVGAIDFDKAARTAGIRIAAIPVRRWQVNLGQLTGLPVSAGAITRALDASWVTGLTQVERHHRVLEVWRPDVVASYGPDTTSIALQAAAKGHHIPSMFLPHCFLPPEPVSWFLHADATPLFGSGCFRVNAVNPLGERSQGLVLTGHPGYDVIAREGNLPVPPSIAAALDVPASRPHVVLLFAEWNRMLLGQLILRRVLEMTAEALPDDALLVCKLHPGREERAMCEEVLGSRLPRQSFRVVGGRSFSTPLLLRACEVAVATEHSMALADAVVAGVPGIAIRQPEFPISTQSLSHPAQDYREVCRVVDGVSQLRAALMSLTHDPSARAVLRAARPRYIDKYLFAADGRSAARVANLAVHLASGDSVDDLAPARGESDMTR